MIIIFYPEQNYNRIVKRDWLLLVNLVLEMRSMINQF